MSFEGENIKMDLNRLRDRFLGSFLGSALGDAIGEIAFRYRTSESLLSYLEENSLLRYTDDTAMALALAEHIINHQGVIDSEELGKLFHEHFQREPWRGYASGPPTIFSMVERHGLTYTEAARSLFDGQGSFGNGAAMRITPVGLFFFDQSDAVLRDVATKSSLPTHSHPLGMEGACVLAKAISLALRVNDLSTIDRKIDFVEELMQFTDVDEYKKRLSDSKQLLQDQEPLTDAEKILGSNITAHSSVPFAIHVFLHDPNDFRGMLLQAALLSRDKDTVAAMTCALLGAHLGVNLVPSEWSSRLENREWIEKTCEDLVQLRHHLASRG